MMIILHLRWAGSRLVGSVSRPAVFLLSLFYDSHKEDLFSLWARARSEANCRKVKNFARERVLFDEEEGSARARARLGAHEGKAAARSRGRARIRCRLTLTGPWLTSRSELR